MDMLYKVCTVILMLIAINTFNRLGNNERAPIGDFLFQLLLPIQRTKCIIKVNLSYDPRHTKKVLWTFMKSWNLTSNRVDDLYPFSTGTYEKIYKRLKVPLPVATNGINVLNLTISETDPKGTVIWNNTAGTNCTWNRTDPVQIKEYFRFLEKWSQLVLDKALDLEVLKDYINKPAVSFSLFCLGETQININITPENEFSPDFLNSPYNTAVLEGTQDGASVYSLNSSVRDRDAFKYNSFLFDVIPYQIEQYDGRFYFSLNNETGEVKTKLGVDYEQLERNWYILRILATDNGGLHAEATLNITIIDVDDMPPEFVSRNNCYRICTKIESYSKIINIYTDGPLSGLQPEAVFARDGDRGINAQIDYTIYNDSSNILAENLAIDKQTGIIEVIAPYANLTRDFPTLLPEPFIINVTIIATEISNSRNSSNASFYLVVYREFPNSKTTLPSTRPAVSTETLNNDDDTSSLLIIEILVPCTLVILIVVVVVVFFLKKRQKKKEMKYIVKEKDKRVSKSGGDMMDSLPATMATPYDLVGAYAHFDIGTYDDHVIQDSSPSQDVPFGTAAAEYANDMSNSYEDMYSKVKKNAPRAMKLRAVDIVEAEGEEEEFGRKGSYDVKGVTVKPDTANTVVDECDSVDTISDNTDVRSEFVNQVEKDDSNSN